MAMQKKPEPPTEGTAADGAAIEQPLNAVLFPASEPPVSEEPLPTISQTLPLPVPPEAASAGMSRSMPRVRSALVSLPRLKIDRLGRWFSPLVIGLIALGIALLFLALLLSAGTTTAAGLIFPDWGLASLRIGVVAAVLGGLALLGVALLWHARVRPLPVS